MKNRIRIIFILLGITAILAASACSAQEKAVPEANPQQNPVQQDGGQPPQDQQPPTGNPPADAPAPDANAQANPNASTGNTAASPSGTGSLTRSYTYPDTNKQIPYRVYVPAVWNASQKLPLVVILHDQREDENAPFDQGPEAYQGVVARLAEQYNFLVVAPLGYSRNGGYGAAQRMGPGGSGNGQGGPGGQPPANADGAGGPPADGAGAPQGGGPGNGPGGPQGDQQGQAPQGTPPAMPGSQDGFPTERL